MCSTSGAGDGKIAAALNQSRPDIEVLGIDSHVRPELHILVLEFDGTTFPVDDDSFDVADSRRRRDTALSEGV